MPSERQQMGTGIEQPLKPLQVKMLEYVVTSLISTNLYYIGALTLLAIVALVFIMLYARLFRKYSRSRVGIALREKNLLEQLFNNIPDRVYFKDRDSRFILANRHVSKIMGENDPSELVNKTDFDFYEEKYARAYYEDEQQIMKAGRPMIAKVEKGLDIDGNEIYISTTKIPIRDRSGKVIGLIGIGRDISEQKKTESELLAQANNLREINVLLEEKQEEVQQMAEELNAQAEHLREVNKELEMLSLVASKTENVVVIMDGNANFEWVNKGFEDHYGMGLEAFVGKYGLNLRENSSHPNISAILNQIYITRKSFTYSSRHVREDGKETWSQTNISPILGSGYEIDKLILIDSDITELKWAEERIKLQKEEIEVQAEKLGKLNITKDRLFTIIAHDLKNPFHSIMGFTELLIRKHDEKDWEEMEEMKEYVELIRLSTNSAYQLLENLLEWARAQTDRVRFRPEMISVSSLIEEVIELQKVHAGNKHIRISSNSGGKQQVFADREMLKTVLRNLISNAIKYTRDGGEITIRTRAEKEQLQLSVTDNGIGIPAERLETLFDLENVSSTAGTAGETGTGLGLQVCSEFMKMNRGAIGATSIPGKGSTFTLRLPIKEYPVQHE